jgi:hypothetical protein
MGFGVLVAWVEDIFFLLDFFFFQDLESFEQVVLLDGFLVRIL